MRDSERPLPKPSTHLSYAGLDHLALEATPELKPNVTCKEELVVHEGILMWGSHVIVPPKRCSTLGSHRHGENERIWPKLYVVAQDRQRNRGASRAV